MTSKSIEPHMTESSDKFLQMLHTDAERYNWLRDRLIVRHYHSNDGSVRPAISVRMNGAYFDTEIIARANDSDTLDQLIDEQLSIIRKNLLQ